MGGISYMGKKIKAMRDELEMTQDDLARLSGVSRSTIAGIETGERDCLSMRNLIKLADAFRLPIDDLIGRENK